MKKTLLVTIDFPPMFGGVANYWANLAKYMPSDDFLVLAPDFDNSLDFDMKQSYLIYRKKMMTEKRWVWPKWLPILWETWRVVRMEKIKRIIVTHVLPVGTVALFIKKMLNIPYVVSLHGLDVAYAARTAKKRKIAKKVLQNAEYVIVNSDYTKNLMIEKLGIKEISKIITVYPCPNIKYTEVDQEKFNEFKNKHVLNNKKIILTVARLIERKGQDVMIKAMKKIVQKVHNAVYVIVGHGEEANKLKELARSLDLDGRVLFFEDIQDEELPYFYQLSDVFVMPSRILNDGDVEGFGIVYLEANCYGRPVVAGNCGGAVEAVLHNQTGLTVDPKSENEITQAIISLLENQDKAKQLGFNGKKRVEETFTWSKQARELVKILS